MTGAELLEWLEWQRWQEEEEERKRKERERIQKEIDKYERKKARSESIISSSESYLEEVSTGLRRVLEIYEIETNVIEGIVETKYRQAMGTAEDEYQKACSGYQNMISNGYDALGRIQEKINALQDEYNSYL